MTEEKFREILEAERDYTLPKPEECHILFGLQIFAKYLPKERLIEAAAHDEIFGPSISNLVEAGITEQEAIALWERNWNIDEYDEGLQHFV